VLKDSEIGFFAYNYRDERTCGQRVGNCGQMTSAAADIDVSMIGGHLVGITEVGDGQFDYLAWGGYALIAGWTITFALTIRGIFNQSIFRLPASFADILKTPN